VGREEFVGGGVILKKGTETLSSDEEIKGRTSGNRGREGGKKQTKKKKVKRGSSLQSKKMRLLREGKRLRRKMGRGKPY